MPTFCLMRALLDVAMAHVDTVEGIELTSLAHSQSIIQKKML